MNLYLTKNSSRNTIWRSLLFFTMFILFVSECSSQAKNENLLERKVSLSVESTNLEDILENFAENNNLPIGFEMGTGARVVKIKIDVENTSLNDVLDQIVKQAPDYNWKIVEGVVNFYPNKGNDKIISGLVKLPIAEFAFKKAANKFEIRNRILDLESVKQFLNSKDISKYVFSDTVTSWNLREVIDFDIELTDTNFIYLLNSVIRESPLKFWRIGIKGARNNELDFSF